jgi:peptide/nickel transport system substrate-binding protein
MRLVGSLALALLPPLRPAASQPLTTGTITIVIGAEPTNPVPPLASGKANFDLGNILFLPLAWLGPRLNTVDEKTFQPALARKWTRRDSLTLVFDLDPRAKWHDGVPVTSRDVVWSLNRARDSTIAPTYALLLREIATVTAEGPARVVIGFRQAYAEQFFDAVYHVAPLPAHLLDTIPASRFDASSFIGKPIGSGAYRWARREPGRQVELEAVPDFFLGAPKLQRVVFLIARNAEAQLNLMLDGSADAYEAPGVLARQITPVMDKPSLRILTQPALVVGYLLFNQKAYGDRSKPHPILADPDVRRAIVLGVDRAALVRATFGPYAAEAHGPMGQASWIRRVAPKQPGYDLAKARALLRQRGWGDTDGDGILDKNGTPLSLRLSYPGSNPARVALAEPIEAMLRQIGIRIELVRLDGPVWFERRGKGEFDIDLSQVTLDPTPSGLVQSWTCAGIGGTNVASICDPEFDRALHRAIRARANVPDLWRQAIATLQASAPAAFVFAPTQTVILHGRYRNVDVRSDSPWSQLWRWSVDPAQRLPRDQR